MSFIPYHNTSHSDRPNIFNTQRRRSMPTLSDDEDNDSLYDSDDGSYRPCMFGTDRPHPMSGSTRPTRCPPGADCWPRLYDLPGTFPRGFQFHRGGFDRFGGSRGADMNDLVIGGPRRRYGQRHTGGSVGGLGEDLGGFSMGVERGGIRGFGQTSADGYMGSTEGGFGEGMGINRRQFLQRQREYRQASPVDLYGLRPRQLYGELSEGLGEDIGGSEGRYAARGGGLFDNLGGGLGCGVGRHGWGGRR
ncbi:hypothetical protein PTTW11_05156 [Pyrenophora teres f. teres]|uniref:Uncharacterized protein n=1 Tax=Pyrenophora teres f. teres TaxID=97479 RepID=A0A6S6W2B3_9PLEO|nr:hypothetical protein PTTW11_05156 [Pyrenophora teres f. teres]